MTTGLNYSLLLVSDDTNERAKLCEIFDASFNLLEADNLQHAARLAEQNEAYLAAVLVDLEKIDMTGVELLNQAVHNGKDNEIPILSLIASDGDGLREELAFMRGASDVIHKPYTRAAILRRVQLLTELHLNKWHLQKLVAEQNDKIRKSNQVMVDALSAIIEHRNAESGNHVLRIRRFTKILLEDVIQSCPEYGLTNQMVPLIAGAAALHDIGKIAVPDEILNKPGKLTAEEFEIMKSHTTVGSELIQNLSGIGSAEYLHYAYNICLYHHERFDGRGYPYGLSGDEIPIYAQIVGIADVFDALTTSRAYKEAYSYEQAINMILNGECGAFSMKLLECFKHVRSKFVSLAHRYADGYSPKEDIINPLAEIPWKSNQLNTSQLTLVKYRTLLHYMKDTVFELDLDSNLYHIVYNPNPDLDVIVPDASFSHIQDLLQHIQVHPEDEKELEELGRLIADDFFLKNMRRRTITCRVYSHIMQDWRAYELTFLRINTGNDEQRIALAIWHPLADQATVKKELRSEKLHNSPALYGLISSVLRCESDQALTISAGAQDLYALTGYTEKEIEELFENKLLYMVVKEDQKVLETAYRSEAETQTELEYRLLRKGKEPIWVLDRSRMYVEVDGQEYSYHAIRENTRSKRLEQELKTVNERNEMIMDRSGSIVFEWDLVRDTMYCSSKWKEMFGYEPVSKNFSKELAIGCHFHPDDMSSLKKVINQIQENKPMDSIEVRIVNANAKYLWVKIIATARRNEKGEVTHILGVIQDIDMLKRATLTLKEQAERDSLTKLWNKTSTQQLISEYLAQRESGSRAALLVVDLDNFKAVNDFFGHLYGDEILSLVGMHLKKVFRFDDVIGRIGGDEFILFLKDIPDREWVEKRCQILVEGLREMLEQYVPGHQVSVSVGVSLVPAHGAQYNDLFRRADEALYLSKSRGKNTYTIYDLKEMIHSTVDLEKRKMTRIDSDENPGMADASFVRFVFRRLYESDDVMKTIDEILAYVGQQFNVSRVYIFENNEDNTTCSNTFEWCNEGISQEKDNLQNVSYIEDIAGWPEVFDERGVFYCVDIQEMEPHFREILEPQGIRSMLQCAIMDNGVFRGYIGFDECLLHRLWTQDQINMLQFLSETISTFLFKKRAQDLLQKQA